MAIIVAIVVLFLALIGWPGGADAGNYEDAFLRGNQISWCHSTPASQMSIDDLAGCEGTLNLERTIRVWREQEALHPPAPDTKIEDAKRAARVIVRGEVSLCPPPHKMTEQNGCK